MSIIHYKNICEITGDILKISVPCVVGKDSIPVPRLDDLALIHAPEPHNKTFLAQVINLEEDIISLQIYGSTKGL